jgi:DNA-binding HxlR family transcriptional regulator
MRNKTSFDGMRCNIAHALQAIGDEWSFLIVRDALKGITRFDEFQRSLPISPAVLTKRLGELVESGILEKSQYSDRPPRFEYVLTPAGRQLEVVIVGLDRWGFIHAPGAEHDPLKRPSTATKELAAEWFAA